MPSKHIYSTIVLILIIGVLSIAILATALDIGDESDCENGEGILTASGDWICVDMSTVINATVTQTQNNFTIEFGFIT